MSNTVKVLYSLNRRAAKYLKKNEIKTIFKIFEEEFFYLNQYKLE